MKKRIVEKFTLEVLGCFQRESTVQGRVIYGETMREASYKGRKDREEALRKLQHHTASYKG